MFVSGQVGGPCESKRDRRSRQRSRRRSGKRIDFKVQTGNSDALADDGRLRAAGFRKIVAAATSTRAKEQIGKRLGEGRDVEVLTGNEAIKLFMKPQS